MLTKEGISGAQVYKDYLRPSLELIASVDLKAGILSHEKGHLEWLVKGDVDWLGSPCKVFLETDRVDGKNAKKSLAVLKELYLKVQEWDERFRRYTAESLTDEVNEWQQEDGGEDMVPVTEADFAARLGISELVITPDGDITIFYKGDHMLWEHTVEVDANISNGISDAMFTG